jgi:hypothetical protein
MNKRASILACDLRALSHEKLAVLAAQLAVALQDIAAASWQTNIQFAKDAAQHALDNSAVEALQSEESAS